MLRLPSTLRVFGRDVALSTAAQLAGKVVQMVLSALVLKLTSSYLSQEGQGVLSAITEFALFLSTAANLGLFANVVRRMAERRHDGRLFSGALVLRLTTGVVFSVIGLGVLVLRGSERVVLIGASLFLLSLLLDQVTSICDGMLQANYLMGRATIALVAGRVVSLVLTLLITRGASAGDHAIMLLLAISIVASVVTAGLSLFFVSQRLRWDWNIDLPLLKALLLTSLPFGLVSVANALSSRFLPDLVAHRILTGAEFASFSLTFRIAQVVSLASTFFMFSVLPSLRRALAAGDWARVRALTGSSTRLLSTAGIVLVVLGSFAGPQLLAVLTHEKYVRAELWFLLPAMLLLAAISYLTDLVLLTLLALDEDRRLLWYALVALAVSSALFCLATFTPGAGKLVRLASTVAGSIVGEATLVVLGLRRVHAILHNERARSQVN